MAIYATDSGGGDFKPVSSGAHAAICDMMVDLGVQETNFGPKHQVYLRWQIPGERVQFEKDGEKLDKPAIIGATYTVSMSEKSNMRKLLEGWRGNKFRSEEIRKFDITAVAGKPCLLNVIHNESGDRVYANVAGAMPLPKGMEPPTLEGEVVIYDADNLDNFDKLRDWLKEKIRNQIRQDERQPEPAMAGGGPAYDSTFDDDEIPFITCNPALESRVQ